MKSASPSLNSTVLEKINYIVLPAAISDSLVPTVVSKMKEWTGLPVEMHVFDFGAVTSVPNALLKPAKDFADDLRKRKAALVSINMSDSVYAGLKQAGFDSVFNRVVNLEEDLQPKKEHTEAEKRRLLLKSLAQGAYQAVDVALNSTVSCDENYTVKADEVPLSKFDLISVIEVRSDFMKANFRLCANLDVLDKLARAQHGAGADVDKALLESMTLELLNMVYGFAKAHLNDTESFRLPPAIPKLLRPTDFSKVKRSGPANLTIMPVVTPMGSFYVELDYLST